MILRHPLRSRASGLALPLRRFLSLKTAVSYCAKPADDGPTYKRLKKAVGPSAGLSWAAEQFKRWPAFTKDAGEDMFLNETTESGEQLHRHGGPTQSLRLLLPQEHSWPSLMV